MDADIQVVNNLPSHGVRLYNGKERETYNCAPYCQPSPVLGDSSEFMAANQGAAQAIDSNIATGVPNSSAGTQTSGPRLSGGNQEPPSFQNGPPSSGL